MVRFIILHLNIPVSVLEHKSINHFWSRAFVTWMLMQAGICLFCIPYPLSSPPSTLLTNPPTPATWSWIPLFWGIDFSQDQGSLIPLMTYKSILCYKCSWSHESLHVYSFDNGLVSGSSGCTDWFILLFLLWGCKPLQLLGSFL